MVRRKVDVCCGRTDDRALRGRLFVGHEKVEGWPRLEIVEHHVPSHVMRDACVKYMPPTFSPMACAEFDLARRKCHVWVSTDFPSESPLDHERLHCNGATTTWAAPPSRA